MNRRSGSPLDAPTLGAVVAVSGTTNPLGARVLDALHADPDLFTIVELDMALDPAEVCAGLGPADTLIHLGDPGDQIGPDGLPELDPAALRKRLADAPRVGHLVVLSSAMAYGAWPTNPVPLTEEAPLCPDPGYDYAAGRAEVERLVAEWRLERPDGLAAVLRPTVSVAAESMAWLVASPWSAGALRASGSDRPSQFLHLDDLASAVDHARRQRLDGPYNVAPEGWLSRDALADLAGPVGRLHLPAGWVARARALRARMGVPGERPGESYIEDSWVVANDRLVATGWTPEHRNDEVYVEVDPGGPLADMSPRRRQELSLAATGLAVVAAVVGAVALVRRRRRS